MTDKLEYYDILTVLVPGVLLAAWIPFCFPSLTSVGNIPHYPDAFLAAVLTTLAIFLGQLLEAVSSLLEPLLFSTWGGRPSDLALKGGLGRYLPRETAKRIEDKLATSMAGSSRHGLFLVAMQNADAADKTRTIRFNALYGYHRSLFFLTLTGLSLLSASAFWGRAASWPTSHVAELHAAFVIVAALLWHRTRQRAFYYVREVLLTSERVLDAQQFKKES